jgi:hypothetical protein
MVQAFLGLFRFSPVNIIPLLFHINYCIISGDGQCVHNRPSFRERQRSYPKARKTHPSLHQVPHDSCNGWLLLSYPKLKIHFTPWTSSYCFKFYKGRLREAAYISDMAYITTQNTTAELNVNCVARTLQLGTASTSMTLTVHRNQEYKRWTERAGITFIQRFMKVSQMVSQTHEHYTYNNKPILLYKIWNVGEKILCIKASGDNCVISFTDRRL